MAQRPLVRVLQLAVLPSLLVYVLALVLSGAAGIRTQLVIRDLAQHCDTPMGVGFLSNVGYLLWISAAAIALFGAWSGVIAVRGRVKQLLICGGLFSLVLCIDDMFLLHDRYVGATTLYVIYAAFALMILLRFRDQVMLLGGGVFLLAVVLLGGSVVIDQFQDLIKEVLGVRYATTQLFEEGSKFMGIATWLAFWWHATASAGKLKA